MHTLALIMRVIGISIMLGGIVCIGYRIYSNRFRATRRLMIPIVVGIVLMIISSISAIPKPVAWMNHIVRVSTMHLSAMYMYIIAERILKNIDSKIYYRPVFYITILTTLIVLVLDFGRRDNLGFLMDGDPFSPQWNYFASYLISYTFMACVTLAVSHIWWQYTHHMASLEMQVRVALTAIGFGVSTLMAFSVHGTILAYFMESQGWQNSLSALYHLGKPLNFGIIVIAIGFPSIFYRLVLPEQVNQWYVKRQYKRLYQLRKQLIRIVPQANRAAEGVNQRLMRLLIDIIDAREIILSHLPPNSMHPKDEAMYIAQLIQKNTVVLEPGPYTPQFSDKAIEYASALSYYLSKYQKRLHNKKRMNTLLRNSVEGTRGLISRIF
jgi:hypothetical protein